MNPLFALLLILAWIVPMVVGGAIASGRRRSPWAGVALGFILGWIGVCLCLFLPHGWEPRRRYGRGRSRRVPRRARY